MLISVHNLIARKYTKIKNKKITIYYDNKEYPRGKYQSETNKKLCVSRFADYERNFNFMLYIVIQKIF